jgi:hypothetical protein
VSNEVTVVVTNWRRPKEVEQICRLYREGTVPVDLIVVDNSGQNRLSPAAKDMCDDVWSFGKNAGPSCRFAVSQFVDTEFVLFADDDMLPGKKCVEFYLKSARSAGDTFFDMGFQGRVMAWEQALTATGLDMKPEYYKTNIHPHKYGFREVDFCVRNHFVVARHLWAVHKLSLDIASYAKNVGHDQKFIRRMLWNDDILMGVSGPLIVGKNTILRKKCNVDHSCCHTELISGRRNAVSNHPDHDLSRWELIRCCYELGWRGVHG